MNASRGLFTYGNKATALSIPALGFPIPATEPLKQVLGAATGGGGGSVGGGGGGGGQSESRGQSESHTFEKNKHKVYPYINLRVDVHEEPIGELRRVYEAFRPYITYYYERPSDPKKWGTKQQWKQKWLEEQKLTKR